MKEIFRGIARVFHDCKLHHLLRIFSRMNLRSQGQRKPQQRINISFRSVKKFPLLYCIVAALLALQIILSQHPYNLIERANAAMAIQTPLSTKGSQIIDSTGKQVLLRGVNWFGMETDVHVPHGLWVRDYKDMLAQIKTLGYNVIRLPFSVQALRSSNIGAVNFNIGSNKDLQGKTPLQVMDIIIQEAGRQGLYIMLDSHRLDDYRIPELWYGDGFTEADWIESWKMLATRYKNQSNVIAADLKNEPHGQASWGTNNQQTDWRLAAERCGNAILSINPKWLIVVEGVEKNVPGQKLPGHWWGGNLEGVKNYPVRLNIPNKLVYSPHEYGAGVYNASWFYESTFPQNLYSRWETGFHYISSQRIAPIWIGEFGGRLVDSSSKEGIWQRQLVDFIKQKNLSFTYWSWNPNSGDTGGILLDDWKTLDAPKQQLLNTVLSATPLTPPPASGQLAVETILLSEWDVGFCVNLRVSNQGNTATKNWKLKFALNQSQIYQTWNANFVSQGSTSEATPIPDWAKVIQPGKSAEIGYCARKLGTNFRPSQFSFTLL
jgi:endoglucanase